MATEGGGGILPPTLEEASDAPSVAPPAASRTKRKLSPLSMNFLNQDGCDDSSFVEERLKRRKSSQNHGSDVSNTEIEKNLYGLTPSLWQIVFAFLPPASLARLLRVSKSFNELLHSPQAEFAGIPGAQSFLPVNDRTELIWQQCHSLFAKGLPKPLDGQTELGMWKLIKGTRCQQCSATMHLRALSDPSSALTAGPGTGEMRVLWPFRVRICASCLQKYTTGEKELILDSTFPSPLIAGLPFVFFIDQTHCVSESVLREITLPFDTVPLKRFYQPHVEAIKQYYQLLKGTQSNLLHDWIEGLREQRQQAEADSCRWESWERKGTLSKINTKATGVRKALAKPENPAKSSATNRNLVEASRSQEANLIGSSGADTDPFTDVQTDTRPIRARQNATSDHTSSSPSSSQFKPEQGNSEAQAKRSLRREDIKRRALTLHPPLEPHLLEHMASFHAALTIAKELDEQQWGILKERLQAERGDALARWQARESTSGVTAKIAKHPPEGPYSSNVMPVETISTTSHTSLLPLENGRTKALEARVDAQISGLQEKILHFADGIIHSIWDGGASLTRDSCFQFAADVLVLTRQAFYADLRKQFPKSERSPEPHLTLENMRWLFDYRVKPLTEHHQKEIFLCHGCENAAKFYGFEAVVQHYAAKHTSTLSLGSIVVHWKAEWPEIPPFHPKPMLLRALAITTTAPERTGSVPTDSHLRVTGQAPQDEHPAMTLYDMGQVQANSIDDPRFIRSGNAFTDYLPPRHVLDPKIASISPDQIDASGSRDVIRYEFQSSAQPINLGMAPSNGATPFFNQGGLDLPSGPGFQDAAGTDIGMLTTDTFRVHQAEMAKLARDLWFATAGIKGLPGPVRVQTIIHHSCEQFVARFHLEPGVNMFLFALNHESAMRPLRSLNGFSCQACTVGRPGALPKSERKQSSTLPHLLNHFMGSHAEYHGLDWRRDMIQLPRASVISDLINAPGIDEGKLTLIASAFPGAFPYPLPPLADLQGRPAILSVPGNLGNETSSPSSSNGQHHVRGANRASGYSGILPTAIGHGPVDATDDDEYDPRRPSYIGRIVDGFRVNNTAPLRGQDEIHRQFSVDRGPVDSNVERVTYAADRSLEDLRPHIEADQYSDRRPWTSEYPRTLQLHASNIANGRMSDLTLNRPELYRGAVSRSQEYSHRSRAINPAFDTYGGAFAYEKYHHAGPAAERQDLIYYHAREGPAGSGDLDVVVRSRHDGDYASQPYDYTTESRSLNVRGSGPVIPEVGRRSASSGFGPHEGIISAHSAGSSTFHSTNEDWQSERVTRFMPTRNH